MKLKRQSFQQGCVRLERGRTWVYLWREHGKLKRQKLGTVDEFPNKAAANRAAVPYRPKAEQASATRGVRMKAIIDRYTKEILPELKFSTRAAYTHNLQNHIMTKWGDVPVIDIKAQGVDIWLKGLTLSPKSKVHLRGLLSLLIDKAIYWEYIPTGSNMMNLVKIKGATKRLQEPVILTVEQFHGLLDNMDREPFRTMVLTAMCLGLRVSELLGLKWKDVDWESLRLKIERGIVRGHVDDVKTRESRKPMPLDAGLVAVLKAWRAQTEFKAEEDWIWASPWKGGEAPYFYTTLLEEIQAAGKRCKPKLLSIGWHTLRHSFRTWADESGAEIGVQKRLMRHSDIRTTMNQYGDVIPETLRRAHGKIVTMAIKRA